MTRSALLLALVLAARLPASSAQELPARVQGPAASSLFAPHPDLALFDTTTGKARPTHWETGMWIGGAIGAVGLGAFVYALCEGLNETDESCLKPGLVGAGLGAMGGGIIGALIGGAFSKRDSVPPADSTATPPDSAGG